jgi:type IV pilus assembly protein PilO
MAISLDELKQLDPRDPGRWPLPVRLGAIVLFFVVATALLLWLLVWNSKKDELAQLQNTEQTLRSEFRTKHAKAVNLDLYKQQLADIEKRFGAMLQRLPSETDMDSLLIDIAQAGTGTGLQQVFFRPQPEQNRDFYAERPIKIRLAGNYHQMGEFVSTIAALPRIVTLHDFSIQTAGRGYDQLTMDVTAKTYRYLNDQELAAATASSKGKK